MPVTCCVSSIVLANCPMLWNMTNATKHQINDPFTLSLRRRPFWINGKIMEEFLVYTAWLACMKDDFKIIYLFNDKNQYLLLHRSSVFTRRRIIQVQQVDQSQSRWLSGVCGRNKWEIQGCRCCKQSNHANESIKERLFDKQCKILHRHAWT